MYWAPERVCRGTGTGHVRSYDPGGVYHQVLMTDDIDNRPSQVRTHLWSEPMSSSNLSDTVVKIMRLLLFTT